MKNREIKGVQKLFLALKTWKINPLWGFTIENLQIIFVIRQQGVLDLWFIY